eukprot:80254_1
MNMSQQEIDKLKIINVFIGLITDYVYHNISLMKHLKLLYNVAGKVRITDLAEIEWDFEHRGNLAIGDVYESEDMIYYGLIVNEVKGIILDVNTAKWNSWSKNCAKSHGISEKEVLLWKLFVLQRFSTHQLAVWFVFIRNYYFMIHVLKKKGSKRLAIAKSVCIVIIALAMYCIFRKMLSILSRQNQRVESEPGEVVSNHKALQHKFAKGKKEIQYFIEGQDDAKCELMKELKHYLPDIRKGTFRNVNLNNLMLESSMIDEKIDFDEPVIEELTEIDDGSFDISKYMDQNEKIKPEPSKFDLKLHKMDELDKQLLTQTDKINQININEKDVELDHIVCCIGDFNEDKPRIIVDELKKVLQCSLCNDKFHLWCLWKTYNFNIRDIKNKVKNEEKILCEKCVLYGQNITKSLQAVSAIFDEIDYHFFDGSEGRIDLKELENGRHGWFNECYNTFELIPYIYFNIKNKEKIESKGMADLKKCHIYFQEHLPTLFNYDIGLVLHAFALYKDMILEEFKPPFGRLSDFGFLYQHKETNPSRYRTLLLDFPKFIMKSISHLQKVIYYIRGYTLAKSIGVTETPNENVGSLEKIVYDDRKESAAPEKVKRKVILRQSYAKDAEKSNKMIQMGQQLFEKNIGSHVMNTHKPDSTYYQGVVNKVNHQQNDSSLSIPLDISIEQVEYTKK